MPRRWTSVAGDNHALPGAAIGRADDPVSRGRRTGPRATHACGSRHAGQLRGSRRECGIPHHRRLARAGREHRPRVPRPCPRRVGARRRQRARLHPAGRPSSACVLQQDTTAARWLSIFLRILSRSSGGTSVTRAPSMVVTTSRRTTGSRSADAFRAAFDSTPVSACRSRALLPAGDGPVVRGGAAASADAAARGSTAAVGAPTVG